MVFFSYRFLRYLLQNVIFSQKNSFQNTQFGETKNVKMSGFKHFSKTDNIYKIFRSNGLDIALFDTETLFSLFPTIFDKRVFSGRHLVRPATLPPTHHRYVPKMGSKPTNVIRDEHVQPTATLQMLAALVQTTHCIGSGVLAVLEVRE